LTQNWIHYHDEDVTMMEGTDTEATDTTPLTTTETTEDTVEIVGTADETTVEAEEEAATTGMTLTPRSKRKSITSRKEPSGTRMNIPSTGMNNTGTHLS
jgi:hypothetical protein